MKGVKNVFINVNIGDNIELPKSNLGKAGNVIVTGKDRKEAEETMEMVLKEIKIEIGPPDTVTFEDLKVRALEKFNRACLVCDECDGRKCAGQVPGMGGLGTGASFIANIESLKKHKILTRVIYEPKEIDPSFEFKGIKLKFPLFAAPITGARTNLGGQIEEYDYAFSVVEGCRQSGVAGMVGDGATPDKYLTGLRAVKEAGGWGIPVFKPRRDNDEILKRIEEAEKIGVPAVGIDIDAVNFITMKNKNQPVAPKSLKDLRYIIGRTSVPVILKGIMSVTDAERAAEAGAAAIAVSNHGGRVMDDMPGTAEVLPGIAARFKHKIIILADGGIRKGEDIFKCLALGADAVMIGRPIAIGAVGLGVTGVRWIIDNLYREFINCLYLTGCDNLRRINDSNLKKNQEK